MLDACNVRRAPYVLPFILCGTCSYPFQPLRHGYPVEMRRPIHGAHWTRIKSAGGRGNETHARQDSRGFPSAISRGRRCRRPKTFARVDAPRFLPDLFRSIYTYLSPPLFSSRRRFTTRTGLGRACMTLHCHRVHFRGRLHHYRHQSRPIAVWQRNRYLSAARRRRSSLPRRCRVRSARTYRGYDKNERRRTRSVTGLVDWGTNATTKIGTVLRFWNRRLSVDSSARLILIQRHTESNDAGQLPNLSG